MQPHSPVSSSSPDASAFSAGLTSPLSTSPANAVMMAHTLFLDIVGFARLSPAAQVAAQERLNEIVRCTSTVRRAIALASPAKTGAMGADTAHESPSNADIPRRRAPLFRPTGDGMAILFWNEAREPVTCAREVTEALRMGDLPKFGAERFATGQASPSQQSLRPALRLRMGVHSGPVTLVRDVNGQDDVSGDGIIRAQRVMDLGDAGHILVSEATVLALGPLSPFARRLSDLGMCRVKHDTLLHVYNFYSATDELAPWGNPLVPPKMCAQAAARVARDQQMRETWSRDAREERVRPFRASLAIAWWSLFTASVLALTLWQLEPVRNVTNEAFPRFAGFIATRLPGHAQTSATTNVNTKTPVFVDTSARSVGGVTAPDYTGQIFGAAYKAAKIQGIHLVESVNSTYDANRPTGEIYRQNPPFGAELPANRKIYVCLFRNVRERGGDGDASRRPSFGDKPLARSRRQSGVADEERWSIDLSPSHSSSDEPLAATDRDADEDGVTDSAKRSTSSSVPAAPAAPPAVPDAPAGDKSKGDALAAQDGGDGSNETRGKSDPVNDEPPWQ